nr:RloB domain-containing protein [Clostridium sp. Marseille-Q2269]
MSNPCFEFWYLLHFEYTTANLKNYSSVITTI